MKRLFLLSWACCLFAFVQAASVLTLTASDGAPGDTVVLTASLSSEDVVVAAEVTVPIGENISYVPGSALLNAARSNGHVISASKVGTDLRVYIYSMGLQPLAGASGELFSCRLVLGDEPMVCTLSPQAVLSNAAGTSLPCSVQPASLTILAPKMQVVNPTIDYGHIPIRSTYTQSLQIRNTGTTPLTVSAIDCSAAEFAALGLPVTVAAGAAQSVTVQYAPVNRGAVSETAVITSDAVNGQFIAVKTVSLIADPFSVNELHVGNTSGIADDTVSVSLTMNNMEPIVAGEVSFKMPKQLVPVSNGLTLSSRATNHQTMMQVHGDTVTYYFFSPDNSPLKDDDGVLGTIRLAIDGTSGYYYLYPTKVVLANAASENMVSATSNGYVRALSPRISAATTLSLPATAVTDTAVATFSVRNTGSAPLTIDKVTFLQEGFTCITPLPIIINNGNTGSIEVQFIPTKEGSYSTTMQVYSNDPVERLHSVHVSVTIHEPNLMTLTGQQNGSDYVLSVGLQNYSDIAALQFDMSGLPLANVSLSSSNRLSQHSVMLVPLGEGNYRIIAFSMANTPIEGHQGEILQIRFPLNDICQISSDITNMVVSTPDGKNKSSAVTVHWESRRQYKLTIQVNDTEHCTISTKELE